MQVRTRFAPSPTGYLHLGGARTALFTWAFARRHQGVFVLRIEDTDQIRSTPEAVQAILEGMQWLGLNPDEGPYYQTQRMSRYQTVIAQMLAAGNAYHCYASIEELEAMREASRLLGQKPRYDGRWRPEAGKALPPIPMDRQPVVRFRNPTEGAVSWDDAVKGTISIANSELDDLIIARADGSPTYNFCVVVDDWDMQITHVIRGDDHVNNTPRQINILQALGAPVPIYAHLPMILGNDGEKLSKRHGAVSVMDYAHDYLPQAVCNYLARLGFGHGDDEIFSREDFCNWFDLGHLSRAPAQFNFEKLNWLNGQYLKQSAESTLIPLIQQSWQHQGLANDLTASESTLAAVVALLKSRHETIGALARECHSFFWPLPVDPAQWVDTLDPIVRAALRDYCDALDLLLADDWQAPQLAATLKTVLAQHQLKMPQLAMPLRLLLVGSLQTPSIDAVQAVLGKAVVLARLSARLPA